MQKHRTTLLLTGALLSLSSLSGTASAATITSNSVPSATGAALIPDAVAQTGDSALVRAAKKTIAHRLSAQTKPIVIDDAYMLKATGGHFGVAPASSNPAPQAALPDTSPKAAPDQTAANKERERKQSLETTAAAQKQEQGRMAAEAEQPYGGDVEEDAVHQRMSQLPAEMANTQQQIMNPPKPPKQ